ncbi:MAG: hypothetical protein IJ424_03715 [Oscillospiraceae bacterium]|nr:hypothetical protein [Oscillospiraceae bacterium]
MLQIVKRKDNSGYESILSGLGLTDISSVKISEAVSNNGIDGYVIYNFFDDCITIYDVNSYGDLMIFDGLVRSALFLAAMSGIEKAVFENPERSELIELKFITDNSNVLEPISEKLGGCEHCRHN